MYDVFIRYLLFVKLPVSVKSFAKNVPSKSLIAH